jgi:hypothetical protein
MNELLKIAPVVLYLFTGVISLIMALKSIFSKKFLPFHEMAYGRPWEDIEKNLQYVIITLLKISGLGFLTVALLLLSFPIFNYFIPNLYCKYAIPLIALLFCTGLFIFNIKLFKKTKAHTPWKNSLYVMIVIIIGIIISSI